MRRRWVPLSDVHAHQDEEGAHDRYATLPQPVSNGELYLRVETTRPLPAGITQAAGRGCGCRRRTGTGSCPTPWRRRSGSGTAVRSSGVFSAYRFLCYVGWTSGEQVAVSQWICDRAGSDRSITPFSAPRAAAMRPAPPSRRGSAGRMAAPSLSRSASSGLLEADGRPDAGGCERECSR